MARIAAASSASRGSTKIGDQGTEVHTGNWYDGGWDAVYRSNNEELAKKAGRVAQKLADSNLVGYSQDRRWTLFNALKKYNWDVDAYLRSGEKSDCDCSSFAATCHACVNPNFRGCASYNVTTKSMSHVTSYGCQELTSSQYTRSSGSLKTGDIINHSGKHAIIVISGINGTTTDTSESPAASSLTGFDSSVGVLDNTPDSSGNYWFRINGEKATKYTTVAKNKNGWWYVKNGKVDFTFTGLAKNQNGWWYCAKGKVDFSYTGMAKNENGWWYVKNGEVDYSYNGIAKNQNGTWKMTDGKVTYDYNGNYKEKSITYEFQKSKAVKAYDRNGNVLDDLTVDPYDDPEKYEIINIQIADGRQKDPSTNLYTKKYIQVKQLNNNRGFL